jgi:hypothetical protein
MELVPKVFPHLQVALCTCIIHFYILGCNATQDRLCGLVVRVLGYRSGGPGSIPSLPEFLKKKKKETVVGLERGPLRLVSTTEELLDRIVVAPV